MFCNCGSTTGEDYGTTAVGHSWLLFLMKELS